MADFVFIRHAESMNNHLAATQYPNKEDRPEFLKHRQPNPELTPDGRGQTALVAKRIVDEYYHRHHSHTASPAVGPGVGAGASDAITSAATQSPFTPRPVSEIWCSYLTRAIETAVAIQEAIRDGLSKVEGEGTKDTFIIPPIRMDSDATETGGHYQYDHEAQLQRGTPGFTNKDVAARWPTASFVFPQKENDDEGWNKSAVQETHALAEVRAVRLVAKMEQLSAKAAAPASSSPSQRPLIIVITHGDFFRAVLRSIARCGPAAASSTAHAHSNTNTTVEAVTSPLSSNITTAATTPAAGGSSTATNTIATSPCQQGPNFFSPSVGDDVHASPTAGTCPSLAADPTHQSQAQLTPLEPAKLHNATTHASQPSHPLQMPANRTCDEAIQSRAAVKQNVGNTSLSHFGIAVSSPSNSDEGEGVGPHFHWFSLFMADNAHVVKDKSQAAAVARFEDKGKTDFEDPNTK